MMAASSPGRPENMVVPPFARLLRGRSGSRGRGRSLSRSSPLFVIRRRINGSSSAAVEMQDARDPGSPKVTCIGQVRIKKKKNKKKKVVIAKNKVQIDTARSSSSTGNRQQSKVKQKEDGHFLCVRCFQTNSLLFHPLSKVVKSRVWLIWRRWLSCGEVDEKMVSKEEDARGGDLENGSLDLGRFPRRLGEVGDAKVGTEVGVNVASPRKEGTEMFVPAGPPKNALLLMRCRSAPHPSAALMSAFNEEGPRNPTGEDKKIAADDGKDQRHITNGPVSKEDGSCSCDDSSREDDEEDEAASAAVGPTPSFSSRPLILTRCKSEPAKKAARLGVVDSSFPWGTGDGVNSGGKNEKWLALAHESTPK